MCPAPLPRRDFSAKTPTKNASVDGQTGVAGKPEIFGPCLASSQTPYCPGPAPDTRGTLSPAPEVP